MGYETAVRRAMSRKNGFRDGGAQNLFSAMGQDEFLDFVDYLVCRQARRPNAAKMLGLLEKFLSDSGSEWAVGDRDGRAALEKRLPEGVAIAASEAIANSASAGVLLGEAWHAAFGRDPDTEEANENAIKAVEEAGWRFVSPNNTRTSLGTMVRDMKAQKDWLLPLDTPEADVAIRMAEALWDGQESRHGGNRYRKPTPDEAEAAVLLAVPLVQWFSSGLLTRRSSEPPAEA